MGSFAAASVVLVRFPFSDLSHSKLRPAVVLADSGRGDWLLMSDHEQIHTLTSRLSRSQTPIFEPDRCASQATLDR